MSKQLKEIEKIEGLRVFKIDCFSDFRGSIFTTRPIEGQNNDLHTDKFTLSKRGTLRGLHGDYETAKLIFCPYGKIQLAVVDVRPNSSSFKKVQTFVLEASESSESIEAVWVPEGCLNGHLVLSDVAVFYYQWTQPYNLGIQMTVKFDDPDLNIPWLESPTILSERDKNSKLLREVVRERD